MNDLLHDQIVIAIRNNDLECVKKLLETGSNQCCEHYEYYLEIATKKGYMDMINLFQKYDADIHYHNDILLLHAMHYEHYEIVRFFINNDANVDILNTYIINIFNCDLDFIKLLIQSGVKINHFMLNRVVENNRLELFKFLYPKISDINFEKIWKIAYKSKSNDIMNYLLDLEIELDFTNSELIENILRAPAQTDILKRILNRVSNHDLILKSRFLLIPVRAGCIQTVKLLLELGLDPNVKNDFPDDDLTPIEIACYCINYNMAKLLLKYGAEPSVICLVQSSNRGKNNNNKFFKLIFESKEWSKDELIKTLVEIFTTHPYFSSDCHENCKILLEEIGFVIDDISLRKIVLSCLVHGYHEDQTGFVDYLVNYFGKERILSLLDYGHLYGEFTKILKNEIYE